MRVIPVLDIMGGSVVQGYRGERSGYSPISSSVTTSPDPVENARSLLAITGGTDIYAADLDAIQRTGENTEQLRGILRATEASIWLDAGTGSLRTASAVLVSLPNSKVVIGSETLDSEPDLREITTHIPSDRRIFSLDIRSGKILTGKSSPLRDLAIPEALSFLEDSGWDEVIILSLDSVGSGDGVDLDLIAGMVPKFPDLSIFAAGGCHSPQDLKNLAACGAEGFLVATALHRQWIKAADIAEFC
ncbi:MAG TPA: phosphoribosylformimino-5-aminoimidazole carboxamide ribotide isomerase [Synergistetes bacterium]|nr:phosphoribosylformimino-5-aminoimidazole carboxamide ribotide isomerase [Synergistota bacterium]